jgi:alpha-N-arabinofuranosidase
MTPQQYAYEYRKYATYLRRLDDTVDGGLYLIACGHNDGWNFRFLREMQGALHLLDALSIHLYVGQYSTSATEFADEHYYRLMGDVLDMEGAVRRAVYLMRQVSSSRPIGLVVDEWGTWYPEANVASGLFQQNALRDALFTACALNMFNRYCQHVVMTNMAQTVNVLQSVLLTQGSQMVRTPTYWTYYLFRPHMGGEAVACDVDCPTVTDVLGRDVPTVSGSASVSADRRALVLTLTNIALAERAEVTVRVHGGEITGEATGLMLTADDPRAHNTFQQPDAVTPVQTAATTQPDSLILSLPPASVLALEAPLSAPALP